MTGIMLHSGWYLPVFLSELTAQVSPLTIGDRRFVAVRENDRVRIFGGSCPHRGAHLGYGGRLDGNCLICPFHGKRIVLGDTAKHWHVPEYEVAQWGDAVFVRLSGDTDGDRGFTQTLKALHDTHPLVAALVQPIAAAADLITENAFDADHFTTVHKVPKLAGMATQPGEAGELTIEGEFLMQTSPWQDDRVKEEVRWNSVRTGVVRWDYRARFFARAFSPGLVVTLFGPPQERHVIVTAAVPAGSGCVARVAVGVQAEQAAELPILIAGSIRALAEDQVVWENLDPGFCPAYDARDEPVTAFREFCAGFGRWP